MWPFRKRRRPKDPAIVQEFVEIDVLMEARVAEAEAKMNALKRKWDAEERERHARMQDAVKDPDRLMEWLDEA